MAPIKKKSIESLENLSLKTVLSSIVADIYLTHLLNQDLKNSFLLSSLRSKSKEELLKATAYRLQILPGLLNDQVRDKLIKEFFSRSELDKWPGRNLDILKVLLNDSVTCLNLGSRKLPHEALSIIGEKCPHLKSLHIDLIDLIEPESKTENTRSSKTESSPARKRRRVSSRKELKPSSRVAASPSISGICFQHLTEASLLYGATNELLASLGQNSPHLEKLELCYSYSVTDLGVKSLCLKNPENHTQRDGCHLHELRVRSFHLNPCCKSLKEIDIMVTNVTHYGVAFLLKYVPHLKSLGDCSSISEALEVLVVRSNILPRHYSLLPTIKRHVTRYKLSKMKEKRVTYNKFLLVSSLCPELRELTLGHCFKEVDLSLAWDAMGQRNLTRTQMGQLRHLKELSLLNVGSGSVQQSLRVIGHQLTHLHLCCRGLNLPTVLQSCLNLTSLTLEGSSVSAPYEALEALRGKALRKLETVRLRTTLPSSYLDLILSNSKRLTRVDIMNIGNIGDKKIEELIENGHFNQLNFLLVRLAPKLTIRAASLLVHKCPKLVNLQDLGGWNITCDEYCNLQSEIAKGNFDINLTYGVISRDTDSDASSVGSEYPSYLLDEFRNILPFVLI